MKLPYFLFFSFCIALPVISVKAENDVDSGATAHTQRHPPKEMVSRLLEKFDKNGDGKLDQSELAAMVEFRMQHHRQRGMQQQSQSNSTPSGQIPKSAQVAPQNPSQTVHHLHMNTSEIAAKMIRKFDANGDGALDRKELHEMLKARWKHHHHSGK